MNRRGEVNRRGFVNWLLGGTSGALLMSVFYPVFRFLSPPQIPEATTNQVAAGTAADAEFLDKRYKIVRFGSEPVIVVKISETDFRAFAATCTHLDCIVEYRSSDKNASCGATATTVSFDLQRDATSSGPPPRPLESVSP